VVREEVRVGKKKVADVETVDEQVRREELTIDQDIKDGTGRTL
jgi:stress response protein YsnF